ncbi:MAG: ATP synthase F1 subunit gamma [Gammaproteobacteria bacterium]
MAQSPREILRRIRGIKSTQQITKAMEMVAAVKVNKVRTQAENARPYVDNMSTIMRALLSSGTTFKHPLLALRDVKKMLLVVLTSDRGLCGTFNVNVINAAKAFLEQHADQDVSIIAIGRKGHGALSKMGYSIDKSYDVPWGDAIALETAAINGYLLDAFSSERVDEVHLIYSRFANVLQYVPTTVQYLPIPPLTEEQKKELVKWSVDFIVEPSFEEVAQTLIPRYLETQLSHSIIESLASENAARMVAMRNASDNADEVIQELTLNYNKARQASITRELLDIIGGVEALRG